MGPLKTSPEKAGIVEDLLLCWNSKKHCSGGSIFLPYCVKLHNTMNSFAVIVCASGEIIHTYPT